MTTSGEFNHGTVIFEFISVIAPVMYFRLQKIGNALATRARAGTSVKTWRRGE